MIEDFKILVIEAIRLLQIEAHNTAAINEFWEVDRNDGEMIALMHSELSEALEEMRKLTPDDNHIAEEFADVLIRIFDMCEVRKYDLGAALIKKMEANKSRPKKHGKRF